MYESLVMIQKKIVDVQLMISRMAVLESSLVQSGLGQRELLSLERQLSSSWTEIGHQLETLRQKIVSIASARIQQYK